MIIDFDRRGGGGGTGTTDNVARQALTSQVGLDGNYHYDSPIESGNTVADDIVALLNSEPVLDDYYTIEESDELFEAKDNLEDDVLAITDENYYSKDDTYTKTEVDSTFATKAEIPDVDDFITSAYTYSKSEADDKFAEIDASYTKEESDAKYATQDSLGQLGEGLEAAKEAIQSAVGLDENLGYDSPIASGNSVADDIEYLTEHGCTTYTAGDGIDISGNTISVDSTVAKTSDIPDVSDFITSAYTYSKSEADARYINEEELEAVEETFSAAINKIKGSAGFDINLNYDSPIASGNTITDDIGILAGSQPTPPTIDAYTKAESDARFEQIANLEDDVLEITDGRYATTGNTYSKTEADSTFATKAEIPDVDDFLTEEQADAKYESQDSLSGDVTGIVESMGYMTEAEADVKYATFGDIPDVSDFITSAYTYSKSEADNKYEAKTALSGDVITIGDERYVSLTTFNALVNRVVTLESAVAAMPTFEYDEDTNTLNITQ